MHQVISFIYILMNNIRCLLFARLLVCLFLTKLVMLEGKVKLYVLIETTTWRLAPPELFVVLLATGKPRLSKLKEFTNFAVNSIFSRYFDGIHIEPRIPEN